MPLPTAAQRLMSAHPTRLARLATTTRYRHLQQPRLPVTATYVQHHTMSATATQEFPLPDGGHIAHRLTLGAEDEKDTNSVIFIHGLLSNMSGTKALALGEHARRHGFNFLAFDARGHGSSSGTFEGTGIADWYKDATAALCSIAPAGRHILVGSSLGGWLALKLAEDHPERVAGLLLIAPALDFTERIWSSLSPVQQAAAQKDGRIRLESNYMEPSYAGLRLIEQGRSLLVVERLQEMQISCAIRILHGIKDDAVPVAVSEQLFQRLPNQDMVLTLVKDGDHRLSRPQDLDLMLSTLDGLQQAVRQRQL